MKKYIYTIILFVLFSSCKKFLDVKPSKKIDTPESIGALEALLDGSSSMNQSSTYSLMLGGEYFSDDAGITALLPWEQNLYLWKSNPFQIDDLVFDWRGLYEQIQNANIILEALEKVSGNQRRKEEIKGAALFYRANAYYNLSSLFLEGPNLKDAGLKFKIPIRRNANIVLKDEYANKEQIQQLIREDLEESDRLLPEIVTYPFRPNKKAAKALKARVFLSWEEYEAALDESKYLVQSGLQLMDYNKIDPSKAYPFGLFNPEVIWQGFVAGNSFMYSQNSFQVNPDLLHLYKQNDLRRSLFYVDRTSGFVNFRGSYEGGIQLFGGLASDEIYLIYAETLVRTGELSKGADVLNELLKNRHSLGFEPLQFLEETTALQVIINERRKELVFRGLRWSDLRRLNADTRFAETLKRTYEGKDYFLEPKSAQYVLPIPARELSFN